MHAARKKEATIPSSYGIWQKPPLLVTRYVGPMGPDDVVDTLLRALNDPAFDPAHNHLVDLSRTTELDFDFGRMMRLATRLEPYYARRSEDTRTAVIAPHDVAFGVSRMYQSLVADRAPYEIGVYRLRDAALCSLNLGCDLTRTVIAALDDETGPLKVAAQSST